MRMGWRVDDLLVYKVVEDVHGYTKLERFFPGLSSEDLRGNLSWFRHDGYDEAAGTVVLSYHSWVVRTPTSTVLIDCCLGNDKTVPVRPAWHRKADAHWMDGLAATGLTPADIDLVVCTHLHNDHVGWLTSWRDNQWMPTFPNARYLFVRAEYEFTRDWPKTHAGDHPLDMGEAIRLSFEESVAPVVQAGQAHFVAADHVVDEYLRFLPSPGHTPGHVVVSAGRDRDAAVFTGDMIHSPIQVRYPGLSLPADEDQPCAAQTRMTFLQRFCGSDTVVFTMHFPHPSAGHVRRWEDGYKFEYLAPKVLT
jgi:glyoxylase-like metal-dependent hydrolase (beta-lactamase superfamily II)